LLFRLFNTFAAFVLCVFVMAPCASKSQPGSKRRLADVFVNDYVTAPSMLGEPCLSDFARKDDASSKQSTAWIASSMGGNARWASFDSDDGATTVSTMSDVSCRSAFGVDVGVPGPCHEDEPDSAPRDGASSKESIASIVPPTGGTVRWADMESSDDEDAGLVLAGKSCASYPAPDDLSSKQGTAWIAAPINGEIRGADIESDDDDTNAPPMVSKPCLFDRAPDGATGASGKVGKAHRGKKGGSNRGRGKADSGQLKLGVAQPSSEVAAVFGSEARVYSVLVEGLPPKLCDPAFLDSILDQADVSSFVLKRKLFGEASGAAVLVDFSSWRAAMGCVDHFSEQCWAEHGAVRAKLIPIAGPPGPPA